MNDLRGPLTAEDLIESLRAQPCTWVPHDTTHGESAPDPAAAAPACSPFLPVSAGTGYTDYVRAATTGRVQLLINGRSSGAGGPDIDRVQPLDAMERAVRVLASGDRVLLAAWFFDPATPLTGSAFHGATTWGGLLAIKAVQGVVIRIIINDFDPVSGLDQWLAGSCLIPMSRILAALPVASRDNLKYIVSRHPAHFGRLRSALGGLSGPIYIGSHHQKFMVTRRGDSLTAFCGGLDIEARKHPASWSYGGMIGWHDVHLLLQGPIAYQLEREFVMRWNREKAGARNAPRPGWRPFETLRESSPSRVDLAPERRVHQLQLTRTISSGTALAAFTTNRGDVREAYRRVIGCASRFLYLENQYFRSPDLADEIVRQGRLHRQLRVVLVVVESAAADDGANPLTGHGDHLQHETFRRIVAGLGARVRIYTMFRRAVHSKLAIADDRVASIGSANANERSFQLDSELNITLNDAAFVRDTRVRLWSFALGVPAATVSGWAVPSFLAEWDRIARINDGLRRTPQEMHGEGITPFDFTLVPGARDIRVPDYLVRFDFAPEPPMFAGPAFTPPAGMPVRQQPAPIGIA